MSKIKIFSLTEERTYYGEHEVVHTVTEITETPCWRGRVPHIFTHGNVTAGGEDVRGEAQAARGVVRLRRGFTPVMRRCMPASAPVLTSTMAMTPPEPERIGLPTQSRMIMLQLSDTMASVKRVFMAMPRVKRRVAFPRRVLVPVGFHEHPLATPTFDEEEEWALIQAHLM
jgi:hypothetical protein